MQCHLLSTLVTSKTRLRIYLHRLKQLSIFFFALYYRKGGEDGYDWVIRLNPDVFIYDDSYLSIFFRSPHLSSVLGNCGGDTRFPKVMTDFLAFRPGSLPKDAFADWTKRANAEFQASAAMKSIIEQQKSPWLLPKQLSISCRTQANGVWHHHEDDETCTAFLRDQPWLRHAKNRIALPITPDQSLGQAQDRTGRALPAPARKPHPEANAERRTPHTSAQTTLPSVVQPEILMPQEDHTAAAIPEHRQDSLCRAEEVIPTTGSSSMFLWDRRHNLTMYGTPKGGATVTAQIMFRLMGVFEKAMAYDAWIHNYRVLVHDRRPRSEILPAPKAKVAQCAQCNDRGRCVKVIRNPLDRAVSSYLFAHRLAKHGVKTSRNGTGLRKVGPAMLQRAWSAFSSR